jgi:sulfite reductase alpha subunit-like flavoprotein
MDEQRVLVLYATETGNAFDAACRIYQEGRRRHLNVHVSSADGYPLVKPIPTLARQTLF